MQNYLRVPFPGGGDLELLPQSFRGGVFKKFVSGQAARLGFTLAEVLITLGIIGVVAALTIPTLVANYREKVAVERLKKAYSTLSNAYIGVLNDYGDPTTWDVESFDDIVVMFSKYIKNAKVCKSLGKGCFATGVRKDLLNSNVNSMVDLSSFVINDGTVVGIEAQVGIKDALTCSNLNYCFQFDVDINGDKPPNRWGVDTFIFHATKDKIIPRGGAGTQGRQSTCNPVTTASNWYNGSGCGAWVIQMGNMDYLKCVNGNQKYCSQKYYF